MALEMRPVGVIFPRPLVIIGVGTFLLTLGLASCFYVLSRRAEADRAWLKEIRHQAMDIRATVGDAESNARGFVGSGELNFLAGFEGDLTKGRAAFNHLTQLVASTPSMAIQVTEAQRLFEARAAQLLRHVAYSQRGPVTLDGTRAFLREGSIVMARLTRAIDAFRTQVAAEQELVHQRGERYLVALAGISAFGSILSVLLLALGNWQGRRSFNALSSAAAALRENEQKLHGIIAEKRQSEEQLRTSETRFRQLADAMPQLVWSARGDGTVDYLNQRWSSFKGPPTTATWSDWEWASPAERDEALRRYHEGIAGNRAFEFECRVVTSAGEERWHLFRAVPILDASDKVERWYGSMTDIDRRRIAETATADQAMGLDAIMASLLDAVVAFDKSGEILSWNRSAERIFGYGAEETRGLNLNSLALLADDLELEKVGCPTKKVDLRKLIGAAPREVTGRRKDGSEVPLEINVTEMTVRGQNLYVGVAREIADRKAAALERRAREVAEAANQAKGQFLANMSHEIRTPMNGVVGMADLLMTTDLSREQREYLGHIKASALLAIINDILDFSKIDAGKMTLAPAWVDIRRAVERLVQVMALRAFDKGLELVYRVDRSVPLQVWCDEGRLGQILLNLLSNAIKFTEAGEVEVVVTVHPAQLIAATEALLIFKIRDTGIGIPRDRLSAIFDPFIQVQAVTANRFGGTGLGLSITKRLVEIMGGKVHVASHPGLGSTFEFHIPVKVHASKLETFMTPALKVPRALVVDPSRAARKAIMALLGDLGVDCVAAEDLRHAELDLLEARSLGLGFDMVVVDAALTDLERGARGADGGKGETTLATLPWIITHRGRTRPAASEGRDDAYPPMKVFLAKPVMREELIRAIAAIRGEQAPMPESTDAVPLADGEEALPPSKILVADDNEVNRIVVGGFLQRWGHQVLYAVDGQEALDLVACHPDLDVVLMDVCMPVLDGIAAVRLLRASGCGSARRLPVVALTAQAMSGDRERLLEAGFDAYVAKPIDPGTLHSVLISALAQGNVGTLTTAESASATQRDSSPVYDQQIALRSCGGNAALLTDVVQIFLANLDSQLATIHKAATVGDGPAIGRSVHRLLGSALTLGAGGVVAVGRRMEAAATEGHTADAAALEPEIARACAELRHVLTSRHGLVTPA